MVNKEIVSGLDNKAREYALFASGWEKTVLPSKISDVSTDRLEALLSLLQKKVKSFWEDVENEVYDMVDVSFALNPQFDTLYRLTFDVSKRLSELEKVVSDELMRREKIEIEEAEKELKKMDEEHKRLMKEYDEMENEDL